MNVLIVCYKCKCSYFNNWKETFQNPSIMVSVIIKSSYRLANASLLSLQNWMAKTFLRSAMEVPLKGHSFLYFCQGRITSNNILVSCKSQIKKLSLAQCLQR